MSTTKRYNFTKVESGKPVSLLGLFTEQWARVYLQERGSTATKTALESFHLLKANGFPTVTQNGNSPSFSWPIYP